MIKQPKEVAIKVENLTKTFRIPLEHSSGLKQKIINRLKGKKGYREFTPLNGISFEVEKGDFFGIVGRNGSGKSTLLKSIANIYTPTKGAVHVNGTLVPFIELGVGFNPELTGRENVFLNGALLGFSRTEMEAMYDDIVDFAEIEDFMDEKLKNYSSGMQVRLAFSIAIKAEGDILLLDEVLAVGDEAFQRKCDKFFEQIKKDKTKTVILVTHSMDSVRRYCNKAILIKDGKVQMSGSPDDVANEYSVENLEKRAVKNEDATEERYIATDISADLLSGMVASQKDDIKVRVSYKVPSKTSSSIRLTFYDVDRGGSPLLAANSPVFDKSSVSSVFTAKLPHINNSNIKVAVSVRDDNNDVIGFLSDSWSPMVAIQRTDYDDPTKKRNWATLFDRGDWS